MNNQIFNINNVKSYDEFIVDNQEFECNEYAIKSKGNDDSYIKTIDFTQIFDDLKKLNLEFQDYKLIGSQLNIQDNTNGIGKFDIRDEDLFSKTPYSELIEEKNGKELFIIAITQTTVDQKPFFRAYLGEGLSAWFEHSGTCPINRQKIQSIYFYSILKIEDLAFSFLEKQTGTIDRTFTKLFIDSNLLEKPELQTDLGSRYHFGEGVEKNLKKAAELFQQAADQDWVLAQFNLGVCYSKGAGVENNPEKAVEFFQKAADRGMADAQYNLGICYYEGKGAEKNLEKATELIQKAADQGMAEAQNTLGSCYLKGKGVEKNLEKAVAFFQKAADQGLPQARYNLGRRYVMSEGVDRDLKKAAELFQQAADQDIALAKYYLGHCYLEGKGVQEDLEKAVEFFQKAVDQGLARAQHMLDQILKRN